MPSTSPAEFLTPVYPWVPDQGDGTFRNPILCADYSDPDVIRVGGDFYLTASSFNCTPGLPILHSRDLVNWRIINHALANLPDARYEQVQHGCGVWAPAIRFHAGKFWIFYPTPDEGIFVVTAEDPAGKWSEPQLVIGGKGLIDPCPLWDEDGKAYLVHAYAGSRAGIKNKLRVRPMAADGSKVLGEGEIVYEDPERQPTLEGPKFHKIGGYYYLSAPAGGVPTGWQLILRSRSVYGPYEPKIVLAQGSTPINGPHQGALVDLPDGSWWFAHFQESQPFGRIVHLQPVKWEDGWPLMGVHQNAEGVGEPVGHYAKPSINPGMAIEVPQTSDDFASAKLGLQWQWHANHRDDWHSLTARPGHLRLAAVPLASADLHQAPNLLMQKPPAKRFAVETRVEFSPASDADRAGLVVMGLEHAALVVQRQEKDFALLYTVNGEEQVLTHLSEPRAELRVEFEADGECRFAYRAEGTEEWQAAPRAFKAREGRWIGAKVGLFCLTTGKRGGHADFGYFRFSAPGNS